MDGRLDDRSSVIVPHFVARLLRGIYSYYSVTVDLPAKAVLRVLHGGVCIISWSASLSDEVLADARRRT